MRSNTCVMCNCGKLRKTEDNNWFQCTNCEELFELNDDGEFRIVDYDTWTRKHMDKNISTIPNLFN